MKFFTKSKLWALLLVTGTSVHADVHPFTPHDLVTFHKLSSSVPSPDGEHVAFTVSQYNPDDNKSHRSLWVLNLKDDTVYDMGFAGSEPLWFGDGLLGALTTGNATHPSQIWYSDITQFFTNTTAKPSFSRLTDYPVDISYLKYNAKTHQLAFTAEVYLDGSLETAKRKNAEEANRFDTGVVYDQLFVRHWDTYINPQRWRQLFVVQLKHNASSIGIDGHAVNIMKGTKLETPVAPFGDVSNFDFSPDGKQIAFSARVLGKSAAWNTNLDIFIVPTDGSSRPKSVSSKNKGADSYPVYSPDGEYLAWLQMATPQYEADKNNIILYNRKTRKTQTILDDWDRSPESLLWDPNDPSRLLITAQDKGHVKILSVNLSRKRKRATVSELVSDHTNGALSVVKSRKLLVFEQSSSTRPGEVFTFDLADRDGYPRRRTRFNDEKLVEALTSDPEEFWFNGANGDKVMGWLYKPVAFNAAQHSYRQYPLAFLIHGGPEGAWNDGWSSRWNPQVFTGAGYAVITINFHGSTGYGSRFTRDIIKKWGAAPYKDLMKGLDYALEQYTFIDRRRVAALGASYGGYMINWINGHTNRFKCLVNHDGIFDTRSTYYSTEELWFPELEFGGRPDQRRAAKLYDRWNPSAYVKRWKTPTLVIHGEKDYRLPVTEGLATFTALQRKGVPSRMLYFPDENHWVLKPANSLRWHKEVLTWLDDWIGARWTENGNATEVAEPVEEGKGFEENGEDGKEESDRIVMQDAVEENLIDM
ncbi:hypothetical protein HK097_003313 [Rhizophlyctis rosea]|uniref:Dipeptidyl-peptidase V n=1 Tax=Rhizophlyctis rosea TaxID=64517 RepID=A0AAD5S4Y7_9FUNG|nr:hypothetical protein HK097_003313 [Rhizophlyctis rosea]